MPQFRGFPSRNCLLHWRAFSPFQISEIVFSLIFPIGKLFPLLRHIPTWPSGSRIIVVKGTRQKLVSSSPIDLIFSLTARVSFAVSSKRHFVMVKLYHGLK